MTQTCPNDAGTFFFFFFVHHSDKHAERNRRDKQSERAGRREKIDNKLLAFGIIAVTKHDHYLWAGLQRPTCSFGFVVFLHAPLTLILKTNPNVLHLLFSHRIRKWEMRCVRVLHRTRYRDHHRKHGEHPEWVKHSRCITLHLISGSLQLCPPAGRLWVLIFECKIRPAALNQC